MIDGYDHIWKWNTSEEKNKLKDKRKQERNICNLWDRQELRALSIKGSYKFTCVPTCTHTHPHSGLQSVSQKHVSSLGDWILSVQGENCVWNVSVLPIGHYTWLVLKRILFISAVYCSFKNAPLSSSPLRTLFSLRKTSLRCFLCCLWLTAGMAPAVLISAKKPPPGIGWIPAMSKKN